MGRDFSGKSNTKKYTESHVRGILRSIGIKIEQETQHDFLCFCPIHGNKHTPSMSVSKTKDGFICFNGDCGASGNLVELVMEVTDKNYFEALRFVLMNQPTEQQDFEEELGTVLSEIPDYREFTPEVLRGLVEGISQPGNPGREYMRGRGFTDDTIDYFQVGYSPKRNMVTVPLHSPDGIPVGVIGRSASKDRKAFKNSVGLPTSKTFFNLHRAKRASSTVILTEASFDSMAVHQSGYPNTVGNLGSHMSDLKFDLLDKHFDRIILFTDNRDYDAAGRATGMKIAERFISRKDILWAFYEYGETYPDGLKDASKILEVFGEDTVRKCIENAIPHYEYVSSMV
jgi:DNA primase